MRQEGEEERTIGILNCLLLLSSSSTIKVSLLSLIAPLEALHSVCLSSVVLLRIRKKERESEPSQSVSPSGAPQPHCHSEMVS